MGLFQRRENQEKMDEFLSRYLNEDIVFSDKDKKEELEEKEKENQNQEEQSKEKEDEK